MRTALRHPEYGEIVYTESVWMWKQTLQVGGVRMKKRKKSPCWEATDGSGVTGELQGSVFNGVTLKLGEETLELVPPAAWYEQLGSILLFGLMLAWPNLPTLNDWFPLVGGGIGGILGAVAMLLCIALMRSVRPVALKLTVWAALLALTVLAGHLLA